MPHNSHATRDEVIALERSYWDAMRRKDGDATAALSGSQALVTGAQGVTRIAKDRMGRMTEEGEWTLDAYHFDTIEVVTPAPDVAIIAYTVTQTVTMGGKTQDLHAADASTWIRGESGWECHSHSETFLKD